MDRRNYLKSVLALIGLGIGSFSLVKWFKQTTPKFVVTNRDWEKRRSLITELAEVIIPTTETPGAKEAGVGNYIISVMSKCYDQSQQSAFISGLDDVDDFTKSQFGRLFMDCDASSRYDAVQHFSYSLVESSPLLLKIKNKLFGKSFFFMLRELTVEGYCTSQLGSTRALTYDPVPGAYEACISLSEHQTSWATK